MKNTTIGIIIGICLAVFGYCIYSFYELRAVVLQDHLVADFIREQVRQAQAKPNPAQK